MRSSLLVIRKMKFDFVGIHVHRVGGIEELGYGRIRSTDTHECNTKCNKKLRMIFAKGMEKICGTSLHCFVPERPKKQLKQ